MKARLNLTIDNQLLAGVKNYAQKHGKSVSELVEDYFITVTKPSKTKSFLDLVDGLKKPSISPDADLVGLYYEEQKKKYGF